VHWALLLGAIFMPISGFLMSSLGGHGVEVFGMEIVACNPDPYNPRKVLSHNETLDILFHSIHHWLRYFVIGALALHISGALEHHLVDKDSTLKAYARR
jgi:cytochrome b561